MNTIYSLESKNSVFYDENDYSFVKESISAFGSAKHKCLSIFMKANHEMYLHCEKGQIGELTFTGIVPDAKLDFESDYCGDPDRFS